MLTIANCKINLGLFITGKRPDGFHDLESVFYPVAWNDAIEIELNNSTTTKFELVEYNNAVTSNVKENLCYKAYALLDAKYNLPAVKLHLLKTIPAGAGLGGGSSNASHTLKLLNTFFNLNISSQELCANAAQLGSDCPFFIDNTPAYVTGRGEKITPIDIDLSAFTILLINPGIHISTAEAFSKIIPTPLDFDLKSKIQSTPVTEWKSFLKNDFEKSAIEKHSLIGEIKESMYANGALYASMSGSGSTVFGIYEDYKNAEVVQEKYSQLKNKLVYSKGYLENLV
jgi:4-diphosphocytidyl-2-C-methyl-D-erythritol kinase